MNEEIKRILKLLEDGKITSDQASELIAALKDKETQSDQPKSTEKHLKVIVTSCDGKNLNIKLPIKFIKGIIKATGKMPVHINGGEEIDMNVVMAAIENEVCGKIVEMNSSKGDYVEVKIE